MLLRYAYPALHRTVHPADIFVGLSSSAGTESGKNPSQVWDQIPKITFRKILLKFENE